MQTRLTTELDAVNVMLATIGEAPVNDLTTAATSDVAFAIATLTEQNREVQTEGWSFNSEEDFDLTPNGSNKIVLADNVLRVRLDQTRNDIDPVVRGSSLFDRKNHTYTFTKNVKVEQIVYLLNFTELPQTVRWYVTIRAARIFQDRVKGNDAQHVYTLQDEMNAKRLMEEDQGDADHLNVLDAPGTADIVNRRIIPWD